MLDITPEDIAELNDKDLRTLIGRLCEATLLHKNISTSGVTYGGNQNAKDGGLDVKVRIESLANSDDYIPRPFTGFQVKQTDMPPSKIKSEMKPDEELREVIKDLIAQEGAYIMVSGKGSTSDTALKNRKEAIKDSIKDLENSSKLKIDFYDRTRVASWVREHPSLIFWVKDKIGNATSGWKPYGDWSSSAGVEYLLDSDNVRIIKRNNYNESDLSCEEAINEVRLKLKSNGASVRLVGLSGVGKTRFTQELFNHEIGEAPLNKFKVFYCDYGNTPIPKPSSFAEQLVNLKQNSVLIIDNCPPDIHSNLTSICSSTDSRVSLLTIEYDVKDDLPESTEVYKLEPASKALTEGLIAKRFKHISPVDISRIADFSGGNARIAIALASTVQRGETNLRNENLFGRLFYQNQNRDDNSLLEAAEVLSLVYSFDGENTSTESELFTLSQIIDSSTNKLYRHVVELKNRELIQQRSIWKAVLPHAIANKLAKEALKNIPEDKILQAFENEGAKRLLLSFSKRLSYLIDSQEAKSMVKKWLSSNSLLLDLSKINDFKCKLITNIAPVCPNEVLDFCEKSILFDQEKKFLKNGVEFEQILHLLRSLAFEKDCFDRCISLMVMIVKTEDLSKERTPLADALQSLFYLFLSGTKATVEQRSGVIKNLLDSNDETNHILGLKLLNASLEAWNFTSHYSFNFGGHSRDYGYHPKNLQEAQKWYQNFIKVTKNCLSKAPELATKSKNLVANHFRGLWCKFSMHTELKEFFMEASKDSFWREGWLSVRNCIRYHGKAMDPSTLNLLRELEQELSPKDLSSKVIAYALCPSGRDIDLQGLDLDEEKTSYQDQFEKVAMFVEGLGRELSQKPDVLESLLIDLFSNTGAHLYSLGLGIGKGCSDAPHKIWGIFKLSFEKIPKEDSESLLLRGFLSQVSKTNKKAVDEILDKCVGDTIFSHKFPVMQFSVEIDQKGIERLKASLDLNIAPLHQFRNLAYGRKHEQLKDDDFSELCKMIAHKEGGLPISIDLTNMRIHSCESKENASPVIIELGQFLLGEVKFKNNEYNDFSDYQLDQIAGLCYKSKAEVDKAKVFCQKLSQALTDLDIFATNYPRLLHTLAGIQPIVFLDIFVIGLKRSNHLVCDFNKDENPLSAIEDDVILEWCELDSKTRYRKISGLLPNTKKIDGELVWSDILSKIFNRAPDPDLILSEVIKSFRPMSWSGSRAEIMAGYLPLISSLRTHPNPTLAQHAIKEEINFIKEIRLQRESEAREDFSINSSFE